MLINIENVKMPRVYAVRHEIGGGHFVRNYRGGAQLSVTICDKEGRG